MNGRSQIRSEMRRAMKVLMNAEQTNQYIGHVYNHLLEPGEGLVKAREQKRSEAAAAAGRTITTAVEATTPMETAQLATATPTSETTTTTTGSATTTTTTGSEPTTKKMRGKIKSQQKNNRPLPPSSNVQVPLLEQITFKTEDFPPLA